MLYGFGENFIEFLSKPSRSYYFSFCQVINFINQCYEIRDVTVFAILIQISFKLIYDIDRVYQGPVYTKYILNILIRLNSPLPPQFILFLFQKFAMISEFFPSLVHTVYFFP